MASPPSLRPSVVGEQEILLAKLASNIKLLRSVVSLLLQVSETASPKEPGSRGHTFHLGRALSRSDPRWVSRTAEAELLPSSPLQTRGAERTPFTRGQVSEVDRKWASTHSILNHQVR